MSNSLGVSYTQRGKGDKDFSNVCIRSHRKYNAEIEPFETAVLFPVSTGG